MKQQLHLMEIQDDTSQAMLINITKGEDVSIFPKDSEFTLEK